METVYRLRIYLGEDYRIENRPAHEAILLKARGLGLKGATLFKGAAGYGGTSRLREATVLRLSEDLPMILEIVDAEEALKPLLFYLEIHLEQGLVTREKVEIVLDCAERMK